MANFTDVQQSYVDKIQNQKLKALVEKSYSVFSMPPDEKTDFVIWLSLIHEDPAAEKELIQTLENEADIIDKELSKASKESKDLNKDELDKKEFQIVSEEYKELKEDLNKLKKSARTQKEKDDKQTDEKEMDKLLNKLNNS